MTRTFEHWRCCVCVCPDCRVSQLRGSCLSGLFCLLVVCLTSQQHDSVSQGRICLTSQQHASVSQGRICLTSQQHASVSQGRICLTSQQQASVSQGRIGLTSQQHASVSQGRICLTSQQHASVSQGRICLTSQQHASVSQGRICSDNFTCCHTEIEVADQTFYLTQSQYTDTGPTERLLHPTCRVTCHVVRRDSSAIKFGRVEIAFM